MIVYILLGASGRLGGVCRQVLQSSELDIATVDRSGDVCLNSEIIGNIYRQELDSSYKYFIFDAAIDYSSIKKLNEYEEVKRAYIETLSSKNLLLGIIAFSSGAVDFSDELIANVFYKNYKNQKIKLENFLLGLPTPSLCLRIYTLIGPESFKRKSTGWVSVFEQALESSAVEISDPSELRSWVSEDIVRKYISQFIGRPSGCNIITPISGVFNLTRVVEIASNIKNADILIRKTVSQKWLNVPYVCHQKKWLVEANFSEYLIGLIEK